MTVAYTLFYSLHIACLKVITRAGLVAIVPRYYNDQACIYDRWDQRVCSLCLSVCMSVHSHIAQLHVHAILSMLLVLVWLGPPLTTMRDVGV